MRGIRDKTAIVTGASRGIGQAIAQRIAAEGANLVAVSRSLEAVQNVTRALQAEGYTALALACDVTHIAAVEKMVKRVEDTFGGVDILINNAGIQRDALLVRLREEDWDAVLETNLKGVYHCTKAVVRGMMRRRGGRIVNVTSVVGQIGNAGQANYAASKAGVIGFTKSVAKELGSRGITVNAVAPGFIAATQMTDQLPEPVKASYLTATPLGRPGYSTDVAGVVAFLVSDDAGFITGQVVNVDGGMVM